VGKSEYCCGIVIHDRRNSRFRTCGVRTKSVVSVNGQMLFAACQRHRGRLVMAFPEMVFKDKEK